MRRVVVALMLPALLALPGPGTAPTPAEALRSRSFRVIAFDYKQRTEDTVTYAAYHANLRSQILAARARFRRDVPTLAFLPEDAGLMAWMVGPRGASARAAADGVGNSVAAIASLAPGYGPAIAHYLATCPGISPARALVLALTDTAWRALGQGLARIAAEERIWILAGLNVGDVSVTREPALVALLADPEHAAAGYAYRAGCEPYNQAVLFRPDAELDGDGAADPAKVLAGRQRKVYLVPIEREQTAGLALASESPADARVIDTGFARLGVLTSKDAWMPDVVERLEIDGMEVFLQPEAGAWAGSTGAGSQDPELGWPPDAMTRAIWSMVQWQAETTHGALSNLTGNFGDLYFDGTATLTRDTRAGEPARRYLLGRPPQAGIVARGRWVFADPPDGVPLSDLRARRSGLQAGGARLAPGSGDSLENGQLASFVVGDITLQPRGVTGRRLAPSVPSVAIAPGPGAQWAPSMAATASGVVVAWTDLRLGSEQPYTARSADGGRTWSAPVRAGDSAARPDDQQDNQYDARVASLGGESLVVVWTDFRNQSWDVYSAASEDGGRTWAASVRVDHAASSAEGYPNENLHQDPVVVSRGTGAATVLWADARGARVDHGIAAARSPNGGDGWTGDVAVDGTGARFAEQWSPAAAAGTRGGPLVVAWQDHRAGVNRVYLSRSPDDGSVWTRGVAVAPSRHDQWQPAVAAGPRGRVAVAWSQGVGGGARRIRLALVRSGRTRSLDVDPAAPRGVRQARPAVLYDGTDVWVAWQDDRAGDWDILMRRITDEGRLGRIRRVDDGPVGAHARLPVLLRSRGRLLVAWEDTRRDVEQVRAASL
ncbi:MAG: nitrilase-related carbon-nitrogen hydrolase [Actinomycetota bacterium]